MEQTDLRFTLIYHETRVYDEDKYLNLKNIRVTFATIRTQDMVVKVLAKKFIELLISTASDGV